MKTVILYCIAFFFIFISCEKDDNVKPKTKTPENVLWTKTFGGFGEDKAQSVQQTTDGGYILVGTTHSFGSGKGDFWLIKTDKDGKESWNKTFGGPHKEEAKDIQKTNEGGYILAGKTKSYGSGKYDGWIVKTDQSGNKSWSKTFGGSEEDWIQSLQQTDDGGYILAGITYSHGPGVAWLIKTDESGNKTWSKTFKNSNENWLSSVRQTADGGYIIAGRVGAYESPSKDVWLIKTDEAGNKEWNQSFSSYYDNRLASIQQTKDKGYILAGWNFSKARRKNAWLMKINETGESQWNQSFGSSSEDWVSSIQQTDDGGYIFGGGTYSFKHRQNHAWLTKTDETGKKEWSWIFGGEGEDWISSIQQTENRNYILAGSTESFGNGEFDAWLIKVSGK